MELVRPGSFSNIGASNTAAGAAATAKKPLERQGGARLQSSGTTAPDQTEPSPAQPIPKTYENPRAKNPLDDDYGINPKQRQVVKKVAARVDGDETTKQAVELLLLEWMFQNELPKPPEKGVWREAEKALEMKPSPGPFAAVVFRRKPRAAKISLDWHNQKKPRHYSSKVSAADYIENVRHGYMTPVELIRDQIPGWEKKVPKDFLSNEPVLAALINVIRNRAKQGEVSGAIWVVSALAKLPFTRVWPLFEEILNDNNEGPIHPADQQQLKMCVVENAEVLLQSADGVPTPALFQIAARLASYSGSDVWRYTSYSGSDVWRYKHSLSAFFARAASEMPFEQTWPVLEKFLQTPANRSYALSALAHYISKGHSTALAAAKRYVDEARLQTLTNVTNDNRYKLKELMKSSHDIPADFVRVVYGESLSQAWPVIRGFYLTQPTSFSWILGSYDTSNIEPALALNMLNDLRDSANTQQLNDPRLQEILQSAAQLPITQSWPTLKHWLGTPMLASCKPGALDPAASAKILDDLRASTKIDNLNDPFVKKIAQSAARLPIAQSWPILKHWLGTPYNNLVFTALVNAIEAECGKSDLLQAAATSDLSSDEIDAILTGNKHKPLFPILARFSKAEAVRQLAEICREPVLISAIVSELANLTRAFINDKKDSYDQPPPEHDVARLLFHLDQPALVKMACSFVRSHALKIADFQSRGSWSENLLCVFINHASPADAGILKEMSKIAKDPHKSLLHARASLLRGAEQAPEKD